MTSQKLEVTSEECEGKICVYTLSGDLMGSAAGYALQDRVREKIADGWNKIVLDLAKVRRIDSSGVGILTAILFSSHKAGGRMAVASLPPQIEKVLEMVFLLDRMEPAASVEQARERLAGA